MIIIIIIIKEKQKTLNRRTQSKRGDNVNTSNNDNKSHNEQGVKKSKHWLKLNRSKS